MSSQSNVNVISLIDRVYLKKTEDRIPVIFVELPMQKLVVDHTHLNKLIKEFNAKTIELLRKKGFRYE
jgi:hypothetical protein